MCQQSLIKHFQEQLPLIHSRALEKKNISSKCIPETWSCLDSTHCRGRDNPLALTPDAVPEMSAAI